jgi:hypothetical protein
MKKNITLAAIVLLTSILAFGQIHAPRREGNYRSSVTENMLMVSADMPGLFDLPRIKAGKNPQAGPHKATQDLKQMLDSLVVHHKNANLDQWIYESKEEYFFDTDGDIFLFIEYDWDENAGQWVGYNKEEYAYDSVGNEILYIDWDWDETTSQFYLDEKTEYTYDAGGNITLYLQYEWVEITSQWVYLGKTERTYNANGYLTLSVVYDWDSANSQWIESTKAEYTVDANGKVLQIISSIWNVTTSQWYQILKGEYTYDAGGNMVQTLICGWNSNIGDWVTLYKHEGTYDGAGNLLQLTMYNWDESAGQWDAYIQYKYDYDGNDNPTEEIHYEMDENTSQFEPKSKELYTYNLSYELTDLIIPPLSYFVPEQDDQIVNMPVQYATYEWDDVSNDWVADDKGQYHYSEQSAGLIEMTQQVSNIYPCPATEYITVRFTRSLTQGTFELYDLQGRSVMTEVVADNDRINISALVKGIYFYRLIVDGRIQRGKLLKE